MLKVPSTGSTRSSLNRQFNFLYRFERALYQDFDESARLKFNILGHRYEIPVSILNNYPNTLLGEPRLRAAYYDYVKDEYVFDRHPQAFESIITFYQSDGNSLAKPQWMPSEMFYEELKFFHLHSSVLTSFYDQEIAPTIDIQLVPRGKHRRYLWLLLNYATHDWTSQLMRTMDFLLNLIALWTLTRDCVSDHQMSKIMYWIEETSGEVLRPIYMVLHLHLSTVGFQ